MPGPQILHCPLLLSKPQPAEQTEHCLAEKADVYSVELPSGHLWQVSAPPCE